MEVDAAFSLISRAIDAGRAAHGYLIVGDLRGSAAELVSRVLGKLFPDAAVQIESRCHPDVAYLEPEGAKRIIPVKSMRERIVEPMALASFSGGWKAGVIVGADRMEAPSANAFLKSLEEPTPRTIYLMTTDHPDSILPTIVSRSQRIDLPLSEDLLSGEDFEAVSAAFFARDAAALAERLAALKKADGNEDALFVRRRFFKTLMSLARRMMVEETVPRHRAFRNVEAVETAYRQSERSMNDEAVLSYMLSRICLPA